MSYIFVFTLISSLVFGNAISFNDSNVESNVQSECSVFNYLKTCRFPRLILLTP